MADIIFLATIVAFFSLCVTMFEQVLLAALVVIGSVGGSVVVLRGRGHAAPGPTRCPTTGPRPIAGKYERAEDRMHLKAGAASDTLPG